jgi:hypothetical protein
MAQSKPKRMRKAAVAILVTAASLGYIQDTNAGDLSVFVGAPRPGENWGRAYGVALTSSLVPVVSFEGEASRVSGESLDTAMTAFTASAVVAPPTGMIQPYAGAGAGVFRQSVPGGITGSGFLTAVFGGVKVKTANILVLKAEYRRLSLSGNPPIKLDGRFSIGAGVSF